MAPRTRILTNKDRVVRPEQLRVAPAHPGLQHLGLLPAGDGRACRERQRRRGQLYPADLKSNAAIHIDSFHDYEPCILAKCLANIPNFRQELTPEYMQEHDLTDLVEVVSVPPLHTPYVPLNSIVREFVGGSSYEY